MNKNKIILWWQKIPSIKKQLLCLFLALGVALSLYFLACLPVITPDSVEYYNASRVLVGEMPFSRWWELRGPIFPAFIALVTSIFGDNPTGYLFGSFVFFVLSVGLITVLTVRIMRLVDNRLNKLFIGLFVVVLVIFNPIIIGYQHAMLTEAVAIPLTLLATIVALRWAYFDPTKKNWLHALAYSIFFGLFMAVAWLLKQPYLTLVMAPLLVASGISLFEVRGWRNLVYRVVVIIVSFGFVGVASTSWSNYLCSQRDCHDASKASNHLNSSLTESATSFRVITPPQEINNRYIVYGVYNYQDEEIDQIMIDKQALIDDSPTKKSLKTLAIFATKHPFVFARSYLFNYFALVDFINFKITPLHLHHVPVWGNFLRVGGENNNLSYTVFQERHIVWCFKEDCPKGMEHLGDYMIMRRVPMIIQRIQELVGGIYQFLFVVSFLFLPVVFVISLVRFLKRHNKRPTNQRHLNNVVLLLSSVSFIHIMSNVLTGSIIDRYVSPVLSLTLLATIIFVSQLFRQKQVLGKAPRQTNEKLLFVIPAYNEADSIAKVIADINKHLPEADIVVVNDNSKDATHQLAEKAGAVVLDMPFNVRYAMAVQTGVKYALAHDYGYVIQFDADGQHLASEAKKMFVEMKRSRVDIVLGSRFLEKTDYPHALARVIGTKVNSSIVEVLSGQKITDPTSGLQCLNRRVIEKYARMGEYPEYPDANLIIEMLLKGYQIKEVPVQMKARETGESMHSGIWKPLKYAIKVGYAIFVITLRQIEIRREK